MWHSVQYSLTKENKTLICIWTRIKQLMCFNPDGANSSLNGEPLKLVDLYLGSSISSIINKIAFKKGTNILNMFNN